MGLFGHKGWLSKSWDVVTGKRSLGRTIAEATEGLLGKHNFVSNIISSADKDIQKAVDYVGGWDNVALMAAAMVLGPWGAAGAGAAGATAAPTLHGVLSAGEAIGAMTAAGYTGHEEYKAKEAEKKDAAELAAKEAEYNKKVAAEEERSRQARRAELLGTKKALTKNITKGYQAGSGGATSTDLNAGSIILG